MGTVRRRLHRPCGRRDGIALLGTVTATFASWLVEAVREESEETGTQFNALQAELEAIHRRLDRALEK